MTPEMKVVLLERIIRVLGEEVARLNDEVDELRAHLALATGKGEELARSRLS